MRNESEHASDDHVLVRRADYDNLVAALNDDSEHYNLHYIRALLIDDIVNLDLDAP